MKVKIWDTVNKKSYENNSENDDFQVYTENNPSTQNQIEKKNVIALSQTLQEELGKVHQTAKKKALLRRFNLSKTTLQYLLLDKRKFQNF